MRTAILRGYVVRWHVGRDEERSAEYHAEPEQRSVTTARVGLLATIAVTALQLFGALLNHDHFTGPAWVVALYLSYSVILGVTALAASLPTHQQDVAVAA